MQFGPDYQRELIGQMVHTEFLKKTDGLLDGEMFDGPMQDVATAVLKSWRKSHRAPTWGQLMQLCQQFNVKQIIKGRIRDSRFDLQQIQSYACAHLMRDARAESLREEERGDYDKAVDTFLVAQRKFPQADGQVPNMLLDGGTLPKRKNLTPLGFSKLDDPLGGGVGAGDLAIVMAPTSGGKTSFLVFLACRAALAGTWVYYVTLEISEAEIQGKIRRCLTGKISPKPADWNRARKKLLGKKACVQVEEVPPHSMTVNQLERSVGRDVQLLIVDYCDYLTLPGSIGSDYQGLGLICDGLKSLGMRKKIPVLTASQVHRAAYEADISELSQVADSLRKIMVADAVFGMSQEKNPAVDKDSGEIKATLGLLKNRYGPLDRFEIGVNWATCQFREWLEK